MKRDLETAKKLLELVRQRMDQHGEGLPYREALDAVLQTPESRHATRSGVRGGHPTP